MCRRSAILESGIIVGQNSESELIGRDIIQSYWRASFCLLRLFVFAKQYLVNLSNLFRNKNMPIASGHRPSRGSLRRFEISDVGENSKLAGSVEVARLCVAYRGQPYGRR